MKKILKIVFTFLAFANIATSYPCPHSKPGDATDCLPCIINNSRGGYSQYDPAKQAEIANAYDELKAARTALNANSSDEQLKNKFEVAKKDYDSAIGNTLVSGMTKGNGHWKPFIGALLASAFITPIVGIISSSITSAFTNKMKLAFKRMFGGINNQVEMVALHCCYLFSNLEKLVAVMQQHANLDPSKTIDARNRVLQENEAEETTSVSKDEAGIAKQCVLCDKAEGRVDFVFECPLEKHAVHAKCLREKQATNRQAHLNCSVCKASRKLEFIQPDLKFSAMTDRLGVSGQGASIVISARVAQKRIDALLKRLEKNTSDDAQISFGELISIRENLRQICNVLDKKSSFKEFASEETRSKLAIFATMGRLNCEKLKYHIAGALSTDDAKPSNIGGLGGFGGGGFNYGGHY